jgi:short-subunit dehydrogenase
MEVRGRRVLITGASRGIGQALARTFAGAGAKVALAARSEAAVKELADELDGEAFPVDLCDAEQLGGLIARVEGEAGPIDILVNNAGNELCGSFTAQTPMEIEATYRLNLVAPVLLCRQVIPRMVERGRGHIVNMSSVADMVIGSGLTVYGSTKAGLTHFTNGLRHELKGLNIGTTVVEVGTVPSEMMDRVHAYPPMDRLVRRLGRLQLSVDVPMDKLVAAILDGVEHDRRFVQLPKRNIPLHGLSHAPQRLYEMALVGVRVRD